MDTWLLIVLIVIAVLALLAVGGAIAGGRRRRANAAEFSLTLDAVDRALADAHAEDKGWDRAGLERAARQAWEQERPGEALLELQLVAVVDKPGVAEDKAEFRAVGDTGEARLTLGRSGERWVPEGIV